MDFLQGDPDRLLSYQTKQQVNIQDRYLGFTFNFLQLCIGLYIVIYVFVFCRGYLEYESAKGAIATLVRGDAVATFTNQAGQEKIKYFSSEELTYPGLENGNVFVATHMKSLNQRIAVCEDHHRPCTSNRTCATDLGGICSVNGFCEEPSWCAGEAEQEVYNINSRDVLIWVKSSIQFIQLAKNKLFSTETDHPYPELGYNAFSVQDLLVKTGMHLHFEDVSMHGAAIEVYFKWDCNVDDDSCKPETTARRVDTVLNPADHGYTFRYSEYISETERILHEVNGVRFFFRSVGLGRKFSVNEIIMKASLNSSLLVLAAIFTDFLMLRVFTLKGKYFARKFEVSPDFSDYMDALKQKEEERAHGHDEEDEADRKMQLREEEWAKNLDAD